MHNGAGGHVPSSGHVPPHQPTHHPIHVSQHDSSTYDARQHRSSDELYILPDHRIDRRKVRAKVAGIVVLVALVVMFVVVLIHS
jgi:hypothetical protein